MARAVIAAARVYGDDPVKVCLAERGLPRRSLTSAVEGLCRATDLPFPRVAAVVKVCLGNRSRASAHPSFESGARAAMRAVEFALGRLDAPESAVGGEACDEIEAAPAAVTPPVEPQVQPQVQPPPAFPRAPLPGPIASSLRPAPPVLRTPPPVADADRPLHELVLDALAGGPLDSMNIASAIDRKEMLVCSALRNLEIQGAIVGDKVEDGLRRFRYRLANAA